MKTYAVKSQDTGQIGAWPVMVAALFLGLCLQFNPLTSTWGLPFTRLSEAVSFVAGGIFFLYQPRGSRLSLALAALPLLFLVILSISLKSVAADGDTYLTLILLVYFVATFMMLTLGWRDRRVAIYFSVGSLVGFGLALGVLILRVGGLDLTSMGLGVPTAGSAVNEILSKVKPGGLWVHGNEAGHVFAMAGAPALYLSFVYRRPLIYATFFIAFAISFTMTLNRGGLIAPTAGLILAYIAAGKGKALAKVAATLIAGTILLTALSFLPAFAGLRDALDQRFFRDYDLGHNIAGRSQTLLAGMSLALSHPFGIGLSERVTQMQFAARIGSPHNGFISLSFQAGLGVAVLYVASLFRIVRNRTNYRSLPVILAIFSIPSMFSEELSMNPVFLFTISLTIAEAVRLTFLNDASKALELGNVKTANYQRRIMS